MSYLSPLSVPSVLQYTHTHAHTHTHTHTGLTEASLVFIGTKSKLWAALMAQPHPSSSCTLQGPHCLPLLTLCPPTSSCACPIPAPSGSVPGTLSAARHGGLSSQPPPPAFPTGFGPSAGQAMGTSGHTGPATADGRRESTGTTARAVAANQHSPHGH